MQGSFRVNDYTLKNKQMPASDRRKSLRTSPQKSASPSRGTGSPHLKLQSIIDTISFEYF